MTNGRRSDPVLQLSCTGELCSEYTPSTVQCHNVGSDGNDAQWKCEANMPDSYQFDQISVSCEGYDNPDDPYVLVGSCGLEYSLELTAAGRDRQRKKHTNREYQRGGYGGASMYQSGRLNVPCSCS